MAREKRNSTASGLASDPSGREGRERNAKQDRKSDAKQDRRPDAKQERRPDARRAWKPEPGPADPGARVQEAGPAALSGQPADPAGLRLALGALIGVHLLSIWAFRYFPSQDGPGHVETASILCHYLDPALPALRQYYTLNRQLVPYWAGHFLLASLMMLASAATAEKLVVSVYVVVLPLAVRWALTQLRPQSGAMVLLIFPFLGNLLLHMGFYNFCMGLPAYFLVLGYWVRHREHWTLRETGVLSLLWLVLYCCHIVPLLLALGSVGLLALWLTLMDLSAVPRRPRDVLACLVDGLKRRAVVPVYAALPALALLHSFLARDTPVRRLAGSLDRQWCALRDLRVLVSYSPAEVWPARATLWLMAGAVVTALAGRVRRRRLERWDGLLGLSLVLLGMYLTSGSTEPEVMLTPRLMLFPFLALILWLATQPLPQRAATLLCAGACAISLTQLGLHAAKYAELQGYIEDYVSVAGHLEPNSTFLPLCFAHKGRSEDGRPLSDSVEVFRHTGGYVAAASGAVDLLNYEAPYVHSPVLYRSELNPYWWLANGQDPEDELPTLDLLGYTARTGRVVDYVSLWGLGPDRLQQPQIQVILSQLRIAYDEVYTSPGGLLHLYRHKGGPDPLSPPVPPHPGKKPQT